MTSATLALPATSAAGLRRRPLALRPGEILRLDRARGTTVRLAAGRVWITEERRLDDVVLDAGAAHRVATPGRALVAAERPSRVVLEWPGRSVAPDVEVAPAEGAPRPGLAAVIAALIAAWNGPVDGSVPHPHSPDAVRDRLARHEPLLRF